MLRRREARYLVPEDRAQVHGRLFARVTRVAEQLGREQRGRERCGPGGDARFALYRHFPAKLDILVTLSRRHDERSTLETSRALRAGAAREVLSGLVESLAQVPRVVGRAGVGPPLAELATAVLHAPLPVARRSAVTP